jgi:hypothetical protein
MDDALHWYKITFSDAEIRDGHADELREAFERSFIKFGSPKDVGLFCGLAALRNHYFISPCALKFARQLIVVYGGTECLPPKRSDVGLLVVNREAGFVPFALED